MQLLDKLGFNSDFDSTAPGTRRKAPVRIAIACAVYAFSAPMVGWTQTNIWADLFVLGELWMWTSTNPSAYARHATRARFERVGATLVATLGWVMLGLFYWFADTNSVSRPIAVALLAGVILYAQKSCDKTPIHMAATAMPPGMLLIALPFTAHLPPFQTIAFECAILILVGFGGSSAILGLKGWADLKAANEELIDERETARAASRAKSEFLANMSHEIRTPLNGVVGVVDVLSRTELSDEQHRMLDIVRESGATLERLLSDVLDISRIEAGRIEIETRAFVPADAVRAVMALSAMRATEKGVALVADIAPELEAAAMGDVVRVKQILGNLMSNAVKFTEAGEVRLTAGPCEHNGCPALRFEVKDTGVGFDASDKDRIFGRFQQADGSITRKYGGTGLGLSISRQLAALMGGELDCVSEPGKGSTFSLVLPFEAAPQAAGDIQPLHAATAAQDLEPAVAAEGESMAQNRPMRVLLADDHPVNRKVVELILGGAGVELTSVEDGKQACEAFQPGAFDIVFMDMQMPVMDGLTAVRLIRAREAVEGMRTPILMLTANALPEHIAAGDLAGADGHLAKPISAAALLAALDKARAFAGEQQAKAA
ncbi:MAG: response regulator [Proteobacteria bacterium]|nr:response regulator [Pseudomonadota bacterium]